MLEMSSETRPDAERPLSDLSFMRVRTRSPLLLGGQLHRLFESPAIRGLSRPLAHVPLLLDVADHAPPRLAPMQTQHSLVQLARTHSRPRLVLVSIRRLLRQLIASCPHAPVCSAHTVFGLSWHVNFSTSLLH